MATKLSVNLNKVALIRNSRGANYPDVLQVATDCEKFGADGITMHPRPDERHARYADIPALKEIVTTELNVEGYPSDRFLNMIHEVKPHQCTLVPDKPGALTSDNGWDTVTYKEMLSDICKAMKEDGIRTSLFVNADEKMIEGAADIGTDRIELYTGPYAYRFSADASSAISDYIQAAKKARELGLGVNAGHDLNLRNLHYFISQIPWTAEVSIGHALISDALYFGLQNAIQMYQNEINRKN